MAGDDLAAFALRAAGMAASLPKDMEAATEKAALKTTTAARASIARAAGGDSRLSGQGSPSLRAKGGAKVGARYELSKAGTRGRAASALVKMSGPLPLLDVPMPAHKIVPKVKKGRANSLQRATWIAVQEGRFLGIKPLRFRDGSFRYGASHPGTRGKRSFWNAVDRVAPSIPRIYQDALASSITRRLIK